MIGWVYTFTIFLILEKIKGKLEWWKGQQRYIHAFPLIWMNTESTEPYDFKYLINIWSFKKKVKSLIDANSTLSKLHYHLNKMSNSKHKLSPKYFLIDKVYFKFLNKNLTCSLYTTKCQEKLILFRSLQTFLCWITIKEIAYITSI